MLRAVKKHPLNGVRVERSTVSELHYIGVLVAKRFELPPIKRTRVERELWLVS